MKTLQTSSVGKFKESVLFHGYLIFSTPKELNTDQEVMKLLRAQRLPVLCFVFWLSNHRTVEKHIGNFITGINSDFLSYDKKEKLFFPALAKYTIAFKKTTLLLLLFIKALSSIIMITLSGRDSRKCSDMISTKSSCKFQYALLNVLFPRNIGFFPLWQLRSIQ